MVTDGLLANAIGTFIIIIMVRAVVGAIRNRRRRLTAAKSSWTGPETGVLPADVTRPAARARAQARWAVVLWSAALYCAVAGSAGGSSGAAMDAFLVITVVAAAGAVALTQRASAVLRPAGRRKVGGGEAAWCLAALTLFSGGLLTVALALGLSSARLAVQDGRLDPTIVMNGTLGRWAATLPLDLVVADGFGLTVLIWTGAYLCSWQARNIASGAALADRSSTSRIIYLANSGKESLTIRASLAGRRSLAGQLTLRLFESFHDVVARLLSAGGPVLMANLVPADLQDGCLIVINAAPPAGEEPAGPELAGVRVRGHLEDVLLVFPPLSEQEIYARWEVFRVRNLSCAPLPALGGDTGRLLVLRYTSAGWLAWHASKRSEAAYAVAFAQALNPGTGSAPQSPEAIFMPVPASTGSVARPTWPVPAPQAFACAAGPSAGPAPLAEVPAPMGAGPTGNSSGDSNIGTGSGPARRRWSRLPWVLAGVAFLLIVAVNAVAVSATTPKAGPVGAAVGQELLPAGALGARFALAHPAGPSAVRLGPLERRGASCAQRSRAWSDPARSVRVQIELTGCWPPGIIKAAQEQIDRLAGQAGAGAASGIPYAVETVGTTRISGAHYESRRLVFRGGPVLTSVELLTRSSPTSSDTSLLLDVARRQLADLPGPPGPGLGQINTASIMGPVSTWYGKGLVLLVMLLVFGSWFARRRMTVRSTGPPPRSSGRVTATDVRRQAGRLAWLARGRFTLQVIGVYALIATAVAHSDSRLVLAGIGIVLLAVAAVLRPRGAVRPLPDRLRAGVLTGRRPIRAVSLVVVSLASVVLVIAMPLVGLLLWSLQRSGVVVAYGRIDPSFLGPELISRTVGAIPLPMLSVDCFVIAAAAAFTIPVSYLAARRIAALTADEASGGHDERVILYLRNFADDEIRMPTSRLSRNSVIERIAVYRFERFEEVLVRHLSRFGPVIAVNPGEIRRPPIGAARMTMSNHEWQARISDHIAKSLLIVVGAAPQRRTDGLGWELSQIEESKALPKTLLVLPPMPVSAVRARWEIFCSMAVSYHLPPELSRSADHHLVLTSAGNGRWRTWHSRRRTEWNYIVALREAARSVLGAERPSRSPVLFTTRSAREPRPMQAPGPSA